MVSSFTLAFNLCTNTFSLPPNTLLRLDPVSFMNVSMTLEVKFEVLMKNYEAMTTYNEEGKNQNAYLRCQLGYSMRQKRKNLVSSSSSLSSAKEEEDERNSPYLVSSSEEEPSRRLRRRQR